MVGPSAWHLKFNASYPDGRGIVQLSNEMCRGCLELHYNRHVSTSLNMNCLSISFIERFPPIPHLKDDIVIHSFLFKSRMEGNCVFSPLFSQGIISLLRGPRGVPGPSIFGTTKKSEMSKNAQSSSLFLTVFSGPRAV